MGYELYMGNILCPVTPSKIQMKIKNQNKTMNLANGDEVNILKSAGLTEISYDLLLPNVKYNFAVYKSGFVGAEYFLNEFEKMKVEKKVFVFKVLRTLPNGNALFNTGDNDNMMVSLEDYTIKEDAKQGFDIVVSIKLKQFRHYGTKIVKVIDGTASVEQTRETTNAPSAKTHKVVAGDTLWNIAKKYYGNGAKYTAIYEANKNIIGGNPNLIYPGQVLTLPGATGNHSNVTSVSNTTNTSNVSSASNEIGAIINGINPENSSLIVLTFNFQGMSNKLGQLDVECTYKGKPFKFSANNSMKVPIDKGCEVIIKQSVSKNVIGEIGYMKAGKKTYVHNEYTYRSKLSSDITFDVNWYYKAR